MTDNRATTSDLSGPETPRVAARFGERWPPLLPLVIVVAVVLCALIGPMLVSHSPYDGSLMARLAPPIGFEGARPGHLLGTDRYGRDTLSRLVYGARISLAVSIVGIALTGTVGSLVGLMAGFFGGWIDAILMRIVDAVSITPWNLDCGLAVRSVRAILQQCRDCGGIPVVARVRASGAWRDAGHQASRVRRAGACGGLLAVDHHVPPHRARPVPSILVLATLHVGYVIVLEAALSFLGVGIHHSTPSWGVMVADGRGLIGRLVDFDPSRHRHRGDGSVAEYARRLGARPARSKASAGLSNGGGAA